MSLPLVITHGSISPWLMQGLRDRFWPVALGDAGALAQEARIVATTGTQGFSKAEMDRLPALRLIAVHGVGYDKVDVAHARSRGIAVTNTPDVLTEDVADMALALVLATTRGVAQADRMVRAGLWPGKLAQGGAAMAPGRRVHGARFGILGLGRIGTAIARRLEPFSPHIAYHNRRPVVGVPWRYVAALDQLARDSDVLIVATSGGAATTGLVDAATLAALGPDGVLINIGRGSIVDETALIEALEAGRIAGAGLDVFAHEPQVPERLRVLDQVVFSPHQGSATVETRRAMADLVLANIAACATGAPLVSPV